MEGIREGLLHVMRTDDRVVLYGQDVGAFGGAFRLTEGFQEEFGERRVFDTPICESAMLGAAIGMATQGLLPVVELQFADFVTTAIHQVINNAGTTHYRTGVSVPMTVRAPCGGGMGGGPFHSEELEAFFCHMPGIKVVYPAFPSDARGMIVSAVTDADPVIFFENKYLYRHAKELVPDDVDPVVLGRARVCRSGGDAAVLTYGAMVHESLRAAESISAKAGREVMVVDMRTLKPYDIETVVAAASATSRVLVVHEAWRTGGFGAELAATVAEHAFHMLDAPVRRLAAPDVPVPFAASLENRFRPNAARIEHALTELMEF